MTVNINAEIETIRNAPYARDVRDAIADSLKQMMDVAGNEAKFESYVTAVTDQFLQDHPDAVAPTDEQVKAWCDANGVTTGATAEEAAQIQQNAAAVTSLKSDLSQLSEEIASGSGSGLSSNAKTLLIAILRNAIYSSDQSGNITELEAELERTSDGGSGTVKYTIDSNLTNVTSDNTKVLVDANASYTATLTVDDGCVLDVVAVIMGGEDVTVSVYADGVITIPAVTGDVIITATAIDPNADILATTTWTDGVRVNGAGVWMDQANRCASDYIEVEAGDIITIMLKDGVAGNQNVEYGNFGTDKTYLWSGASQHLNNNSSTYSSSTTFTVDDSTAYIRISYMGTSSNIIITATRQRGSV